MRVFTMALACLATLNFAACGPSPELHQAEDLDGSGIINGTVEKNGSELSQYVGALRYKKNNRVTCSASILSSRLMLTAAHCVESKNIKEGALEVVFDVNANSPAARVADVEKILVYPDYFPFNFETISPYGFSALNPVQMAGARKMGDLAILLLKKDIPPGFKPVTLLPQNLKSASVKTGIAAGFGVRAMKGMDLTSAKLGELRSMKGNLQYAPQSAKFLIQSSKSQSVCQGDSGGPMFANVDGSLVQIGVASHLSGLAKSACGAQAAAYTDVSAFNSWIQEASADILTQREFISARWLNSPASSGVSVVNGVNTWLVANIKKVELKCKTASASLIANFDIDPVFISESQSVGKVGNGTSTIELNYKGKVFDFGLKKDLKDRESRITVMMDEAAHTAWTKDPLNTQKIIASGFDKQPLGADAKSQDFYLSLNGYQEGRFRVAEVTDQFVRLTSTNSKLGFTDLRPLKKGQDGKEIFNQTATCEMQVFLDK